MKRIERGNLVPEIEKLKAAGFDCLVKITAVDYKDHLEVGYILVDMDGAKEEFLKVDLKNDNAWIPTIMHIFKSADWHEREIFEMFGIEIRGRKTNRLLIEKWDGVDPPLRKSFVWNAPYKSAD